MCVCMGRGGVRGLRENERVMGESTKSWKESDRYISSCTSMLTTHKHLKQVNKIHHVNGYDRPASNRY